MTSSRNELRTINNEEVNVETFITRLILIRLVAKPACIRFISNLPQYISSLPSMQSSLESQTNRCRRQAPSLKHRNSLDRQTVLSVIYIKQEQSQLQHTVCKSTCYTVQKQHVPINSLITTVKLNPQTNNVTIAKVTSEYQQPLKGGISRCEKFFLQNRNDRVERWRYFRITW